MKKPLKYILAFAVLLTAANASAQMKTSYFMDGSTFRYDMNPALAPERGYVKIPVLGGVGVTGNLENFSVKNFVFNKNGQTVTFMHSSVSADEFLKHLSKNNGLDIDASVNVFGIGNYTKRYFWSFDMGVRVLGNANVPKDFFRVLKTMSSGTYDIKDIRVDMNSYMEMALGCSVPINSWITVGGRVKGLLGIASATAHIDQMTVNIGTEEVTATAHGYLNGNISGMDFSDLHTGTFEFDNIMQNRSFKPSNLRNGGIAFDLGAEARLLDERLKVSASVTDLGWLWYNSASGFRGESNNITATYGGYDFDTKQVKKNVDDIVFTGSDAASSTQRLNTALNIGAEYNFLDNRIGVGLLSHTKFMQNHTFSELTLSGNFRPLKWLDVSLSHSFINNGWATMGFALNIHPKGVNIFLGSDCISFRYAKVKVNNSNVMLPIEKFSASVYFGLAISLREAQYGKSDDVVLSGESSDKALSRAEKKAARQTAQN